MSNTAGSFVLCPLDIIHIVIKDGNRVLYKGVMHLKVSKEFADVNELADTFVRGIDLCLSRTPSSDRLTFGLPLDGSIQVDDVTRHRAGFEKFDLFGWRVPGLVLWTPVSVGEDDKRVLGLLDE